MYVSENRFFSPLEGDIAFYCSIIDSVESISILFPSEIWHVPVQSVCGVCGSVPPRDVVLVYPQWAFSVMQSDIYNPRRHVGIHPEHISDVSSRDFPGHYPGEDNSWDLDLFRKV